MLSTFVPRTPPRAPSTEDTDTTTPPNKMAKHTHTASIRSIEDDDNSTLSNRMNTFHAKITSNNQDEELVAQALYSFATMPIHLPFHTTTFTNDEQARAYLTSPVAKHKEEDKHIGFECFNGKYIVYTSLLHRPFRLHEWEETLKRPIKWHTLKAYFKEIERYVTMNVTDADVTVLHGSKGYTKRKYQWEDGRHCVKLIQRTCTSLAMSPCATCSKPNVRGKCIGGMQIFIIAQQTDAGRSQE